MVEKMLEILVDYTERVKLLDEEALEKIIDIVVESASLQDYYAGVSFPNDIRIKNGIMKVAEYNSITKNMDFYIEAADIQSENQSKYDILFEGFELVLFQNVMMLKYLLHELGHPFDYKRIDSKLESGTEIALLSASAKMKRLALSVKNGLFDDHEDFEKILYFVLNQDEAFDKNYPFDPMERVAETRAYETILKMLELIKDRLFNLQEFVKASLLQYQLKAYIHRRGITPSPSEVFLCSIDQEDVWTHLDFYDPNAIKLLEKVRKEYSLDERLKLGLPLSNGEYNELRLRYKQSVKGRTH